MAAANGRLRKELNEVGKVDKSSGVSAAAAGDGSDLRHLKGKINGPESTCYEGGIFEIDIRIPKQYPFEPPKVGDKMDWIFCLVCNAIFLSTNDSILLNCVVSRNPLEDKKMEIRTLFETHLRLLSPFQLQMKFTTKIWHPNISSQTGAICLVSEKLLLSEEDGIVDFAVIPLIVLFWSVHKYMIS